VNELTLSADNDDCYLCDGCGEIETTDRNTSRVTVPCPECIAREIAAERANRAAVLPQVGEAKPNREDALQRELKQWSFDNGDQKQLACDFFYAAWDAALAAPAGLGEEKAVAPDVTGDIVEDKELIKRAARAIGIESPVKGRGFIKNDGGYVYYVGPENRDRKSWNPLTDDGDALRLAVKLELSVYPPSKEYPKAGCQNNYATIDITEEGGSMAATRRAIVRAAAAMADTQGGI
jgi:hypothetical protein